MPACEELRRLIRIGRIDWTRFVVRNRSAAGLDGRTRVRCVVRRRVSGSLSCDKNTLEKNMLTNVGMMYVDLHTAPARFLRPLASVGPSRGVDRPCSPEPRMGSVRSFGATVAVEFRPNPAPGAMNRKLPSKSSGGARCSRSTALCADRRA